MNKFSKIFVLSFLVFSLGVFPFASAWAQASDEVSENISEEKVQDTKADAVDEKVDEDSAKSPEEKKMEEEKALESLRSTKSTESYFSRPLLTNAIRPSGLVFELKPGGQAQTDIFAANSSIVDHNYEFYVVDTTVNSTGKPAAAGKSVDKKEVGAWAKIVPSKISLEPKKTAFLSFELEVPQDMPYGQYRGAYAMEKLPADSGGKGGVRVATRVARFIDVTVTPDPFEIPFEGVVYVHPPVWKTLFPQYFFFFSLALFLISVGMVTLDAVKKRKAKK
jgi:hypothetical protein